MNVPRFQTAVYWAPAATDGYGGRTYSPGIEIAVRWQIRNEVYVDSIGKEARSQAVVYPELEVKNEGWLYLGALESLSTEQKTDPTLVPGAKEIRSSQTSSSLRNDEFVYKAYL